MVPAERIELPTFGLQNRCTTAVLRRHLAQIGGHYTDFFALGKPFLNLFPAII